MQVIGHETRIKFSYKKSMTLTKGRNGEKTRSLITNRDVVYNYGRYLVKYLPLDIQKNNDFLT